MEITVKTQHLTLPAPTREFAQQKFMRLERFHPALRAVEVILKESGQQMVCDVHMLMDHRGTQVVSMAAGDINSAVDLALDRCERQLVRLKEKMRSHGKGSNSERRFAAADAPAPADDADDDEGDGDGIVDGEEG